MLAFRAVYRNPWNVALALAAFSAMVVFYLWSSQVLVIGPGGVSILSGTQFVIAASIMGVLFGLLVPLLVYASQLALATAGQAGGTALGAILGTASMSCCAPVVLPAILSLLGFSGTAILRFNQTVNRFWLPLAVTGIVLLLYSLVSVVQAIDLECALQRAPGSEAELEVGARAPSR